MVIEIIKLISKYEITFQNLNYLKKDEYKRKRKKFGSDQYVKPPIMSLKNNITYYIKFNSVTAS